MTQEEKARAYDEALKKIQPLYEQAKKDDNPIWSTYEYLIPELHENEDERIRKEIIGHIKDQIDSFISASDCRDKYEEEELARYKSWLAYLEKQKEPDNEEGDFTIYHPQKNGEGKYECIPFSFYGSLTAFSNDKDLMDFLNECFYDKKECERWCEVENKPELPECKHKVKKDSVFDYLCESSGGETQKEQKPAEWSEEDERYINGLIGLIEDMKVGISPKLRGVTADRCIAFIKSLRPQQKYEWNEADENALIQLIENGVTKAICKTEFKFHFDDEYAKELIEYIRAFNPAPHWKPSKEQMNMLKCTLDYYGSHAPKELVSLYEDLKKL